MLMTENDLPMTTRTKVVDLLNTRLTDCKDLQTQTKQARWNVNGPNFIALHKLFDEKNLKAIRFQYEWHDSTGQWCRNHCNELWESDKLGLMRRGEVSINDVLMNDTGRNFFWPAPGSRPEDQPGIPDVQ